jgi:hypothetical protein
MARTSVSSPPRRIGQRNRWLAPIGAADLDGDGRVEIAYVDRPHLARTLRVWRSRPGGTLTEIATATGLTNHRIGEAFITGGIRDARRGPRDDHRQCRLVPRRGHPPDARWHAPGRDIGPFSAPPRERGACLPELIPPSSFGKYARRRHIARRGLDAPVGRAPRG